VPARRVVSHVRSRRPERSADVRSRRLGPWQAELVDRHWDHSRRDSASEAPWKQIDALLQRTYKVATRSGHTWRSACSQSTAATTRRRSTTGRGTSDDAGHRGEGLEQGRGEHARRQPVTVDVSRSGQKIKEGYKVWPVATAVAKGELYPWLKLRPPTAERLRAGRDARARLLPLPAVRRGLFQAVDERAARPDPKARASRMGLAADPNRENHFLDTRVYARAAAFVLGLDRFRESDWTALEKATNQHVPPPDAPQPPTAPRGRFGRSKYLGGQ
jgi:phage terminase large subunit GpA-like protein